ncbi:MAG TPA: Spy/CpxP family protein refolding chaperone [Gammaproteobacteria bacterium]
MSNQDTTNQYHDDNPHRYGRRTRHGFVSGIVIGALGGVLLAVSIGAFAQFDRGFGGRFGARDPELAAARVDFVLDVMLDRIDATGEQRLEISEIVDGLMVDLQTVAGEHESMHEQVQAILSQPTVDRAALEQIRANAILTADTTSQTVVQALGDIAESLTPEQRLELMELRRLHRH